MLICLEHILSHDLSAKELGLSSEKRRMPSPKMLNTIQSLSINDDFT